MNSWMLLDQLQRQLTKVVEITDHLMNINNEALKAKDLCNKLNAQLIKENKNDK